MLLWSLSTECQDNYSLQGDFNRFFVSHHNVTLISLSPDTHPPGLTQLLHPREELHTSQQLLHTEDTSLLTFLDS